MGLQQHFHILSPISTHFQPGACEDADCENYRNGWKTLIDESTELGQKQARYIRTQSGREFDEHRDEAGLTVFTFHAGQPCFSNGKHLVRTDRPALFLVRTDDGQRYTHSSADSWADDLRTHQGALLAAID